MQKRGILFLLICILAFSISFSGTIYAQEGVDDALTTADDFEPPTDEEFDKEDFDEEDLEDELEDELEGEKKFDEIFEELEEEYEDAGLEIGEGITPDSAFYFFEDSILSKFRGDIENREKKIAEVKAMIREGKHEEAREALERYTGYADDLQKEIPPEKREQARRSAAAIRNTLDEVKDQIPEEQREEFFNDVINREGQIVTAVEIAAKIKDLCQTLAEIDPLEYSRICKTEEDAPKWQRELNEDLTEEQKKEARKFARIMSECFESSGQQCRCEEIPFTDFAEMCSEAASLATACEIEGDEEACEQLDDLEMPELPPHLQEIFDDLEEGMMESQFELHMPFECREAGATNPKECMKIMVQTHAPPECRDAILEADIKSEREAREICDEIMFRENTPPECVEAGVQDPKECGKIMFQMHASIECIEAGLTGEHRSDEKKCREMMGGRGPEEGFGPAPAFGSRCKGIQDPLERLECYDSAGHGAEFEHFEKRGGKIDMESWPEPCKEAGALDEASCRDVMSREDERFRREREEREGYEQVPEECKRAGAFSPDACERHMREVSEWQERDREFQEQFPPEYIPHEGEFPPEYSPEMPPGEFPPEYVPPEDYIPPETGEPWLPPEQAIPGPADGGPSEPGPSPEPPPESSPPPEESPPPEPSPGPTGGFITGNTFLEYYFGW